MPSGISNGNHHVSRSYREFMARWAEEEWKRERAALREKLEDDVKKAYQELIAIDPEGGEAWYDDDENVPAVAYTLEGIRDRARLVRARIDELRKAAGDG